MDWTSAPAACGRAAECRAIGYAGDAQMTALALYRTNSKGEWNCGVEATLKLIK